MVETRDAPPGSSWSNRRRLTAGALVVYVIAAAAFLALGGGAPDDDPGPAALYDVTFETLDGAQASFAGFEGEPLIINFFASWCAPCVQEMPDFETLHQRFPDQLAIVGLAVEGARPARNIVEETGVTYDIGLDPGQDLLIDLGGVAMPTTVFVSPRGRVLETHSGLLTLEDLERRVRDHFDL